MAMISEAAVMRKPLGRLLPSRCFLSGAVTLTMMLRRARSFMSSVRGHVMLLGSRSSSLPVGTHRDSSADCLDGCRHHCVPPEGVHINELHTGHSRSGEHRSRNCIWNVVEFQVKKDARAQRSNLFHRCRAGSRKKLVPDFKHPNKVGNLFCKL